MDKQGFCAMLAGRKVPAEKMENALELAERFEQFAEQTGGFSTATAWAFSKILIAEGQNSEENFLTLARYGLFARNNAMFVAFLEVLDGGEAQENLYKRVAERYFPIAKLCGFAASLPKKVTCATAPGRNAIPVRSTRSSLPAGLAWPISS